MPGLLALGLGVALIAVTFYLLCKPRPLPGIPYDEHSANSILGDMPGMIKHSQKTGQIWSWVVAQNEKLNSPIVQIFPMPLQKPWIIITDYREAQDILMRRSREFDRSDIFANVFKGMVPNHHITMASSDPRFKAHRKLIQDLMTPAFLNEIAAPQIYAAATSLLDLWDEKIRLAKGRPFSAVDDLYRAALDMIWSVTFPTDPGSGIIPAHRQLLAGLEQATRTESNSKDDQLRFPEVVMTSVQQSILTLTESLGIVIKSPVPKLTQWFLGLMPYMRKANAEKEAMIREQLSDIKKAMDERGEDIDAKCAMAFILRREFIAATKENRKPSYDSRMIFDELFGLLVAGHDTTSTTLLWGLKNLTDNEQVQRRLQKELHHALPDVRSRGGPPTVQEIVGLHIPYLDATQEEIIRTSLTASVVSRTALVDVDVLGHHLPRGSTVWFVNNGPDFMAPPIGNIAESQRSDSCQAAKVRARSWDPLDIHLFNPDRWLVKDNGHTVFDLTAGPQLAFGLGPRGCFGRRLAYLQIKIFLVLLVWDFQLKVVPQNLSSYEAVDRLTHQPKQCYVRLEKVSA